MLNSHQSRYLKGLAHKLKPVVIVGQHGLTDTVVEEISSSIEHHELIKVRVNAGDREERKTLISDICSKVNCELINSIGHIAVFYRSSKNIKIVIPRA